MPTLRSHTHLQATQATAQTKACKRVCLTNLTGTVQTGQDGSLTERRVVCNTGLSKVKVHCPAYTLEVNQGLDLLINPDSYRNGENRHFRQARKR